MMDDAPSYAAAFAAFVRRVNVLPAPRVVVAAMKVAALKVAALKVAALKVAAMASRCA
jgi:hypothetical protein